MAPLNLRVSACTGRVLCVGEVLYIVRHRDIIVLQSSKETNHEQFSDGKG